MLAALNNIFKFPTFKGKLCDLTKICALTKKPWCTLVIWSHISTSWTKSYKKKLNWPISVVEFAFCDMDSALIDCLIVMYAVYGKESHLRSIKPLYVHMYMHKLEDAVSVRWFL